MSFLVLLPRVLDFVPTQCLFWLFVYYTPSRYFPSRLLCFPSRLHLRSLNDINTRQLTVFILLFAFFVASKCNLQYQVDHFPYLLGENERIARNCQHLFSFLRRESHDISIAHRDRFYYSESIRILYRRSNWSGSTWTAWIMYPFFASSSAPSAYYATL